MESPTTPTEGQCQPELEAPDECDVQPEEEPCPPADNADDDNHSVVEDPALECPPEEPSEEDQPPTECDVAPSVEDTQPETPPEEESYASDLPVSGDAIPAEGVSAEFTPPEALEPQECPPEDEPSQADSATATTEYIAGEDIDAQCSSDTHPDAVEDPQQQEEQLQGEVPADDAPGYSSDVQLDEGTTPENSAQPEVTEEVGSDRSEPLDENALSTENATLEQPSGASQLKPPINVDRKVPLSESFELSEENAGLAGEQFSQEEQVLELEYVDGKESVGDNLLLSTAPPLPPPLPLQNNSTAQIFTQRADQVDLLPTAPPPPPPKPEGFLTLTYGWGSASEEPQPIQTTQDYRPPPQNNPHPTPERSNSRTHFLKADDPATLGMSDRPPPDEQIRRTHASSRRTQDSRSSTGDATTSRLEPSRGLNSAPRKQEGSPSTTPRAGKSSSKAEQADKTQQSQASVSRNISNTTRKPQAPSPSRTQEAQRPSSTLTPVVSSSTRQEVREPAAASMSEKIVNENSESKRTASAPKLRETQISVAQQAEGTVTIPTGFNAINQKPEPRRSTPSPKVQDNRSTLPRSVSFGTTAQQPEPRRTTSTPRLQDNQPMMVPDVIAVSSNTMQQEQEPRRARSMSRIQDPRPLATHDNTTGPAILEQNPRPQTIYHTIDDRSQSPEPGRTSTPASYDFQLHRSSTRGTEHRRGSQIYWADEQRAHGPESRGSSPPVPPVPPKLDETTLQYVDPRSIPLNGTLRRNSTFSSSNGEATNGFYSREDKASRKRTAGERIEPTLETAKIEKEKYTSKAKWSGIILNVAIALQVLLGSLTTGLSVATSGHRTQLLTAVFGGLSTLVASYLARSRGSNEPELSIARTKDLEQFIRECEAFKMDHGHEDGETHKELLIAYRRRFEDLLGNGSGERRLSAVSSHVSQV